CAGSACLGSEPRACSQGAASSRRHRTEAGPSSCQRAAEAAGRRSEVAPRPGSPAWTYLSKVRALPAPTLERAVSAGLLREGVKGTVWALHQSAEARVTGWEMR